MIGKLFYVSEEHIGPDASPEEALRVIELLRTEGWIVAYGDARWEFESDEQRDRLNGTFQWAVDVIRAERTGADEHQLVTLVQRRLQLNGRLQAYEADLMASGSGIDYWRWLLTASTSAILGRLLKEKEKGVSE